MRAFGRNSGLINMASSAAFQTLAWSAVYAATKAYVLLFSEALERELRRQGTRVLAVCPGPVETNFFRRIGSDLSKSMMDSLGRIVAESLAAFDANCAVLIPGRATNRPQALATRRLPRAMVAKIAEGGSRKVTMAGHDHPARS